MKLINIRYIRDTHQVILYFKDHCVTAPATWQTYNLYCEFHKRPMFQGDVIAIDINTIKWNGNFSELIAL